MDGFVIQNAWNDRDAPLGRGGGVYLEQARITISNCRIRKNYAGGGGGMWIQSSAPDLVDCTLVNNRGRGISSNDSHPRIAGCRFERNYTPSDGAGLGLFNGSTTSVVDSSFYLNRSDVDGGAYFGLDAASFVDCVFMGNTAHDWGGAVRQWRGPVELINCSFYDNSTNWWAGGISALDDATITNCIFWGNTGRRRDGEDAQVDFYGDHTVITNTLVEGWTGRWGGEGNFDANPKWVDAQKGNLRLRSNSPCIDAGTDDAVTEPTDLDGNPRILGGRVDIGAYENLCREVLDLAATVVEDDAEGHSGDGDGVCESGEDCIITATVAVDPATLPAGSTVRVTFTSVDKDGNPDVDPCCADRTCGPGAHCPTVRKARIDSAGQGIATLRQCPDGAVTVCIEGCGERLCRDVDCP
ncbi:MAG: right-handed parallel beta-helix repeat-containing protein [Phycisphaerales bacterium]|nr:right-handed parallel beta-helix repeat-containing protein [Phycisphaerales bacterium]